MSSNDLDDDFGPVNASNPAATPVNAIIAKPAKNDVLVTTKGSRSEPTAPPR